MYIIFRKSK